MRSPCEARAHEILLRFLSPTQKRDLKRAQEFWMTGSHGTRYKINCEHYSGNVYWCDSKDMIRGNLCGHSSVDWDRESIPLADHLLAQMLSLVTNEIAWLRIAHLMGGDYPPIYYRQLSPREAERLAYSYCRCDWSKGMHFNDYYCARCGMRLVGR